LLVLSGEQRVFSANFKQVETQIGTLNLELQKYIDNSEKNTSIIIGEIERINNTINDINKSITANTEQVSLELQKIEKQIHDGNIQNIVNNKELISNLMNGLVETKDTILKCMAEQAALDRQHYEYISTSLLNNVSQGLKSSAEQFKQALIDKCSELTTNLTKSLDNVNTSIGNIQHLISGIISMLEGTTQTITAKFSELAHIHKEETGHIMEMINSIHNSNQTVHANYEAQIAILQQTINDSNSKIDKTLSELRTLIQTSGVHSVMPDTHYDVNQNMFKWLYDSIKSISTKNPQSMVPLLEYTPNIPFKTFVKFMEQSEQLLNRNILSDTYMVSSVNDIFYNSMNNISRLISDITTISEQSEQWTYRYYKLDKSFPSNLIIDNIDNFISENIPSDYTTTPTVGYDDLVLSIQNILPLTANFYQRMNNISQHDYESMYSNILNLIITNIDNILYYYRNYTDDQQRDNSRTIFLELINGANKVKLINNIWQITIDINTFECASTKNKNECLKLLLDVHRAIMYLNYHKSEVDDNLYRDAIEYLNNFINNFVSSKITQFMGKILVRKQTYENIRIGKIGNIANDIYSMSGDGITIVGNIYAIIANTPSKHKSIHLNTDGILFDLGSTLTIIISRMDDNTKWVGNFTTPQMNLEEDIYLDGVFYLI
jgi:hypothetical protein